MAMLSLFPNRSSAAVAVRSRRGRRGTLRARSRGLGSWERLGLGFGDLEQLEQRSLMAADLVLAFNDNIAANVDKTFYSPASQVIYTLTLENKGDATATDAVLTTSLASSITQKTWTAAFTGGATGAAVGAGDLNTKVTLPANGKAVFTIIANVGASATGDLVSSASVVAASGETNTANNSASDTDRFVPKSLIVTDDAAWSSTSLVRLVNPTTGALIAQEFAFEPDLKTGVRAALAELNGDGKFEVVAVRNYGSVAELVVFRQDISVGGGVTLVKDTSYSLQPFGPEYDRGLNLAVGDFNGDSLDDVAVSRAFGPGVVKIYLSTPTAVGGPLTPFRSFTPFPAATGGASIAAGDLSWGAFYGGSDPAIRGQGKAELIVGSGIGVRAVVQIYDVSTTTPTVIDTIRPFAAGFTGGTFVSVARVNADATPDIIVSAGSGGGSLVEVYDGRVGTAANARLTRFAAFADLATRNAPVFATGLDTDGDGRANRIDVVQGGPGTRSLRSFSTAGVRQAGIAGLAGAQRVAAAAALVDANIEKTSSGLMYRDLWVGAGAQAVNGKTLTVHYTGALVDGTVFDSSRTAKVHAAGESPTVKPFSFTLGNGSVIQGWDEGLLKMKVGGRTQFFIPANLAYGSTPRSGIPANSMLVFDVELLGVR
jgi:uncharacterized repeat protein (TIGR01451 family)